MGFLSKMKTQASNIGSSVAQSAAKVTGDTMTSAKENSKLIAINNEINSLNGDLISAYQEIGKKYVEYLVAGGEAIEIGVQDTLIHVDVKLDKIDVLKNELVEIEKELGNQLIMQEKAFCQKEFEDKKDKLDKALKMDLIDKEEYESKICKARKRVDNFDAIRKVEKQYDMELISEEEKKEKLAELV